MVKRDIVLRAVPEIVAMASRLGFEVVEVSKEKIVRADENIRATIEKGNIRGVYGVELIEYRDSLHYRRSGLNHVICDIMAKNNVALVINVKSLRDYAGRDRSVIIGRLKQNIRLCRKYRVSILVGSFAEVPEDLRSPHDVEALLRVLGVRDVETKNVWA